MRDPVGARPQSVDLGADRAGLRRELVARSRQHRLAARAIEELRPELPLEVGDAIAHRRLRSLERSRRRGEPPRIDDGQKEAELIQGEGFARLVRGLLPEAAGCALEGRR